MTYGAGILAALDHDVWSIEFGSGDVLRVSAPLLKSTDEMSAVYAHCSARKRHDWLEGLSLADVVDTINGVVESPSGLLSEALEWAEVIVTPFPEIAMFRGDHRVVVVTTFGLGSERNAWKISGTSLFHLSGLGIVSPRSAYHGEDNDGPPQAPWGSSLEYLCGSYVAFAALGLARLNTGALADVSLLDCLLPLTRRESAAWQYDSFRASRRERLWKVGPSGFYECADGYLYLHVVEDRQWIQLCRCIHSEALEVDVRLSDSSGRFSHESEIDRVLGPWCKSRTRAQVFEIWGAAGIPCGPAFSVTEARAFAALIDERTTPTSKSWMSPLPIRNTDAELRWLGESELSHLALHDIAGGAPNRQSVKAEVIQ